MLNLGQSINKKDKWKCEHHLLLSHFESQSVDIKSPIHSYNDIKHCLISACGELLTCLDIDRINRLTYQEGLSGLHIKNRKLFLLISR